MSLEPKRKTKAQFLKEDKIAAEPEVKPKVKHHKVFMYPLRPEPNPALAPFFDRLEEVRARIQESESSTQNNLGDRTQG